MKKIILCLLILSLSLSLVACKEKAEPETAATYVISAWAALPDSVTTVSRCVLSGGKIVLCCREEEDEESAASYAAVLGTDGSGFKQLPLPLDASETLLDIAADGQSGLWGLCEAPDGEAAVYTLRRFDESGKQIAEIPLNDILDREGALRPYARCSLITDGEGTLCVTVSWSGNTCVLLDSEGKHLFTLRDEGGSSAAVIRLADGRIALYSSKDGGWSYRMLPIDVKNRAWDTAITLGTTAQAFGGAGEDDYYLYDSSVFYACDAQSGDRRQLFSWAELGLAGGDAHVLPLGEGRFAVLASAFSQTGFGSYEYCVAEPGEDRRTLLTMTSLQPDDTILEAVAQFNKINPDYRVELRSLFPKNADVSDSEWDNALTKLSTELIAGKIPDILDLEGLPVASYVSRGLLEDLYPYLQNDPLIREEDYFDHVFSALSVDGKLPYVTANVMLLTMFAAPDAAGAKPGWTAEEFAAFKAAGNTVESVSPDWFLQRLLCADNRFVSWESGACRFDSAEFIGLLELSKGMDGNTHTFVFPDGTAEDPASCVFVNAASVFDFALYNALYDGKAVPVGYPGTGDSVHVFRPLNRIGIASTGLHKDGAWAFARSFLEAKQQESGAFLPIRKASFDKIARAAAKGHSMWAGQLYYGAIREEDIALARDVLNRAAYSLDSTDGLTEVIATGAAAYFAGEKTAQEAAADIQQKATLYVSEKR